VVIRCLHLWSCCCAWSGGARNILHFVCRWIGVDELDNPSVNKQPLTPALSPYEGERVNLSLVLECSNGLDFRGEEVWHPSGMHGLEANGSGGRPLLPSTTTGYLLSTLRVDAPEPGRVQIWNFHRVRDGPGSYGRPFQPGFCIRIIVM
jgi:hypothetical protein